MWKTWYYVFLLILLLKKKKACKIIQDIILGDLKTIPYGWWKVESKEDSNVAWSERLFCCCCFRLKRIVKFKRTIYFRTFPAAKMVNKISGIKTKRSLSNNVRLESRWIDYTTWSRHYFEEETLFRDLSDIDTGGAGDDVTENNFIFHKRKSVFEHFPKLFKWQVFKKRW